MSRGQNSDVNPTPTLPKNGVEGTANQPSFVRGALTAAGVALGWLLHDAGIFLRTGEPFPLELLPGSALALLIAATIGALCTPRPVIRRALLLGALVATLIVEQGLVSLPTAPAQLPLCVFLLGVAFTCALALLRFESGRAWRLPICLGVFVCAAGAWWRHSTWHVESTVVLAASLAAAAAWLPNRPLRLASGCLAVILPALWFASREGSQPRPPLSPPTATAEAGAPNLVLIVLDTTRADRLGCYGYERDTTPGLDAFAREHATVWTQARSMSSWTLPSHATLFTGRATAEHGATHPRIPAIEGAVDRAQRPALALAEEETTIAERLYERGYQTGAIVSNGAYLNRSFQLDQGFEHYDDRMAPWVGRNYVALPQLLGSNPAPGHRVYRDGSIITDTALAWLDERREGTPFFLMLNYMDTHEPRMPPPALDDLFEERNPEDRMYPGREFLSLIYDRSLYYLDQQVTRFLEGLTDRGLMQGTAVVITADHGEALGEHDYVGHAWTLFDENIHVPLIVKPAHGRERERVEEPIGTRGVHELMLALVGLPSSAPDPQPEWISEWFHSDPPATIARWAEARGRATDIDLLSWSTGTRKWIVGSDGSVRAFDLAADPLELHPLELSPEARAEALQRARDWWAQNPPRLPESTELTPDLQHNLDALGY